MEDESVVKNGVVKNENRNEEENGMEEQTKENYAEEVQVTRKILKTCLMNLVK